MEEKFPYNLNLPLSITTEFDLLVERFGIKKKWMVNSAAILLLLDAPEALRNGLIREVSGADSDDGGCSDLLRKAKAGTLRRELLDRLAQTGGITFPAMLPRELEEASVALIISPTPEQGQTGKSCEPHRPQPKPTRKPRPRRAKRNQAK